MNIDGLTQWFDREGVDYPWGEDNNPYRVWISEVMLQQTVVNTVIPFFEKWMKRFPTLESLAKAEEGEVLRHWEGLGYYSRARNIHRAAKLLSSKEGFPSTYTELTDLPGIGDYTASAILSISFGQARPVIDANVKRICQRIGAHPQWTKEVESLWRERLSEQISQTDPGLFNCAIMQLGQIVCRRSSPSCDICPFEPNCEAKKRHAIDRIPQKKKREVIELASDVLIFQRGEKLPKYWIIQRREGIGRGLWTFPRNPFASEDPVGWNVGTSLKERIHTYTKYKEKLHPRILVENHSGAELPPLAEREGEGFWATPQELSHLATPAVYRKIINEMQRSSRTP